MKVRAKRFGFHGNGKKKPGAVFDIKDIKEFSDVWMESLEGPKDAEAKPEAKPEAKLDAKPEVKHEVKAHGKHQGKQNGKDADAKSSGDADVI